MEIVTNKHKMLYTSFATLILSGVAVPAVLADDIQGVAGEDQFDIVVIDSTASANAVSTSEATSTITSGSQVTSLVTSEMASLASSEPASQTLISSELPHSHVAEVIFYDASRLEARKPVNALVSVTTTEESNQGESSSESQSEKNSSIRMGENGAQARVTVSIQDKPIYNSESTLYTSELAGNLAQSQDKSEMVSEGSLDLSGMTSDTSVSVATSEVISELASSITLLIDKSETLDGNEATTSTESLTSESASTIMKVGWADSTSTSDVFDRGSLLSFLQSENKSYTSEVMENSGSTTNIVATPISSEVYTIVQKRDSNGVEIVDKPVVTGNTDMIYLARGEVLNVNFDVNKMNGTKIKGLNLVLDGTKIHHSLFVEGTLDDINAGLSAYHLAEQTTGVHEMSFELIDTNNNIHYLTQSFSVFNPGERPANTTIYTPIQYNTTDNTGGVANSYQYDNTYYTEVATRIQATAVNELAATTRSLTQQLAGQIAEALSELSQAIAGHAANNANSMDIFQAARHGVTQTAKKIAETISDPEAVGKQALAVATIALVLLVLYLAAITFI